MEGTFLERLLEAEERAKAARADKAAAAAAAGSETLLSGEMAIVKADPQCKCAFSKLVDVCEAIL